MKKNLFICATLVMGLLSATASAETLSDALAMAYTSNPQLQAERATLRATDERLWQARAARLPGLQADASTGVTRQTQSSPFFGGTETYYPRSLSLSANQTLYGGGGIQGQIDLAQVNIEIGRNNLHDLEQQVLLSALTAYVDVRRNMEVVRIRANNVEVLQKQLQAAEDRFTVGEITRTGVSQAKARLAGARSQLAGARAGLANARAAYERTVGQAPGTLEAANMPAILPDGLASAIEWAEGNAPVLRNSKLAELAAVHGISIAKAGLRPRLTLGARASTADNNGFSGAESDSLSTSLNFSMPLFTGGLNQSRVREAKQQASAARIGVLQARRITHEQVSNAWNGLVAARSVIAASEEQVKANELAFEGVEQEAEVGLRTTLDVLDAEQELLDARLALVSANRDAMVAAYGLLRTTGRLSVAELKVDVNQYDPATRARQGRDLFFSTDIEN
jgi:outer membrane protein